MNLYSPFRDRELMRGQCDWKRGGRGDLSSEEDVREGEDSGGKLFITKYILQI